MSVDRIEWGFQVPERERWRPGEAVGPMDYDKALEFVQSHPECTLVSRRVQIGDWAS